jgi:hypothetical protein
MLDLIPTPNLGKKRDEFTRLLNRKVGKGNWYWAFGIGKKLYSWDLALQIYEDAYWIFFRNHLTLLKKLAKNYTDVFEFDKTDMESGLDFSIEKQKADHYQDIAIRRALRRFGIWFQGKDGTLLELPGSEYGEENIPFHLPHLIEGKKLKDFHKRRVAIIAMKPTDKIHLGNILIR